MKPLRSPRKRPQQRRSQATVDAILDAAVHVFRETGFAAATTNAVATRAGVSIGSLYQYFPNKLALLEALRERHVRELSAAIGLACDEACALPWPAALRHVVTRCRAYNRRHLPLLGILHRELPVPSHAADRLALAHSTRQHQLRKLLEAHRASITVGVDQALFMLPALARGIFSAAALEQPDAVEDEKFVDEIMAVMLGYLA
ncbi:MAG TPA: TetR/AcrR family transcriptional regulator [Opitutus sp.]|nr:TetR/AcrR family transcriptional regulator [Opitutus sp.]